MANFCNSHNQRTYQSNYKDTNGADELIIGQLCPRYQPCCIEQLDCRSRCLFPVFGIVERFVGTVESPTVFSLSSPPANPYQSNHLRPSDDLKITNLSIAVRECLGRRRVVLPDWTNPPQIRRRLSARCISPGIAEHSGGTPIGACANH